MAISKVFLTGAGGFVGGRTAHRIALGEDLELKALIHTPSGPGAMRLARLPVEIEVGSVLDQEELVDLMEGCDAVINCAFGMGKTSVVGTRNLLEAAQRVGVDSFVHLSSAVVHGHGFDENIDESTPVEPDDEYGEWKAKGERAISAFTEHSTLAPAIIRPLIVYGPHGHWVTQAVTALREGAVLADGGRGTLNPVYVDNLVDAILLAAKDPDAAGEVFMAVDDDNVSWRQFYTDVSRMVGDHPPVKKMSRREIEARKKGRLMKDSVVPPVRAVGQVVTSRELHGTVASELSQTPWAEPMVRTLPERVREPVLGAVVPDEQDVPFETLRSTPDSSRSGETNLPDRTTAATAAETVADVPDEVTVDSSNGTIIDSSSETTVDSSDRASIESSTAGSSDRTILDSSSETATEPPDRYQLPSTQYIKMQTSNGRVSNQKLKDVLGWEQRVSYDEGMELVSEWLAYEGVIQERTKK